MVVDIALVVECSPSMHKALDSSQNGANQAEWCTAVVPVLRGK